MAIHANGKMRMKANGEKGGFFELIEFTSTSLTTDHLTRHLTFDILISRYPMSVLKPDYWKDKSTNKPWHFKKKLDPRSNLLIA